MGFYRQLPPLIEARTWDETPESTSEIIEWIQAALGEVTPDGGVIGAEFLTDTLAASPGDWVVQNSSGEFRSYPPDEFETLFEATE